METGDAESKRGFVIHIDECHCSDEDEHKTDDGDSVYTDSDTDTESDWESVDEKRSLKNALISRSLLPKFTVTAATTKSKTSSVKTITKPLDGVLR